MPDKVDEKLRAVRQAADEALLQAASTREDARNHAAMLHDKRIEIRREIASARQSLRTAHDLLSKI